MMSPRPAHHHARDAVTRDSAPVSHGPAQLSAAAARIIATAPPGRIPGPINRLTAPVYRAVVDRRVRHQMRSALAKFDGDIVEDRVAGVRVSRITPRGTATSESGAAEESGQPFLVYLHGGGFFLGHPVDPIVLALASSTGLPAISVQYGLLPHQRHPVALNQVTAAWRALTETSSASPVLVATSAGGNLALALLSRIASGGDSAGPAEPAAAVLIAPWSDLTPPDLSQAHRLVNEGHDPLARWGGMLDRAARLYAGAEPTSSPSVSPINARFEGLRTPILVKSASRDLFAPDITRLVEALRRDGVTVTLDSAPGLWHSYQMEPDLPETAASHARTTAFIAEALGRGRHR